MRLQAVEGNGPATGRDCKNFEGDRVSTALPFGQNIPLATVAGPTYVTAQTLVQQVAYGLSHKLFTYSPPSFDLDVAVQSWRASHAKNALGEVPGIHALETRTGAGAFALGYMFSPDYDLQKRHVPQSILASAGSLEYLRSSLDQLSLLYGVANPTNLQIAAVTYDADSRSGLVTDYCAPLALAEELGWGLVSSRSTYEMQHMALLSTLMSIVLPSMHAYDGITVGRETVRVIDVLSVGSLKRTYEAVLEAAKGDLCSKRLTNEGKMNKLMQAFNAELGTEYRCFEYHGHASPTNVVVVFGTVESSLSAQVVDALAQQGVTIGVINVRVYRPFVEEEFLAILPPSAQHISVLGQVKDQLQVSDNSVASSLYADVLAAVNFQSLLGAGNEPRVFDIKYARETVWTVARAETLLRRLATKPGEAVEEMPAVQLTSGDMKQFSFWDVDASETTDAPVALAQLLSDDSALNVTLRTTHDNLRQGGAVRTDLRCSRKSIEAAYSVKAADVAVVAETRLLADLDILGSVRDEATVIVRSKGWKEDDVKKNLSVTVRKTLALKKISLYFLDPALSTKTSEDPAMESYLLQLAFLKLARPQIFAKGLQSLKRIDETLDGLANDVDLSLTKVEVPESWLTVEPGANESAPPMQDLNVNSFVSFEQYADEPPSYLRTWVTAAKGLAFKEAYGTSTALRPDLTAKTATVHVKEHRRLTPQTYDRNIFHIEFDLGDSGLKYEIGEALGIHAENDQTEVEKFIKWYGLDHDEVVEVPSRDDPDMLENRTVYQALMQNVDIFGRPPKRFYEALSEFASEEKEKTELLALGTGANQEVVLEFKRRAEVDTITFADVLLEFSSAHPSFHDIVRIVSPMKRREYSIASSQKVTPNSVSLLIVTVNWVDSKGRDRFGQATRYLNHLAVGAPVTVSIKPSVMKLPPKTTQPIIMAGLGTGLAPFRAFVQERAWQKTQGHEIGDVFLYMGARHQREEYLYGEEWEAYQDAGIITLLGCAFSRDQSRKIYIQDRMRETLADIRRAYLRANGAFYLCGPTWPVPDVTSVLEEAVEVEAKAGGGKRDGRKEIERLKDDGRYVLEVY